MQLSGNTTRLNIPWPLQITPADSLRGLQPTQSPASAQNKRKVGHLVWLCQFFVCTMPDFQVRNSVILHPHHAH